MVLCLYIGYKGQQTFAIVISQKRSNNCDSGLGDPYLVQLATQNKMRKPQIRFEKYNF